MIKTPVLFLCAVILSACATGQYQWVDVSGQGQAAFSAAHSRCLAVGQNAQALEQSRVAAAERSCALRATDQIQCMHIKIGSNPTRDNNDAYMGCMSGFGFQRQFVTR